MCLGGVDILLFASYRRNRDKIRLTQAMANQQRYFSYPESIKVSFFYFQDMIHIADTKVERRYGDFFIRQIHKFDEVRRS